MTLNPATDLVALHAGILADVATIFPAPWTHVFYLRQFERMPVPCISYELTSMEPDGEDGGNIGTDQWNAVLRFEAYLFQDYKTQDYRIKTRLNSAKLAQFLVGHQWTGASGGPCRVVGAYEDRWKPDGGAAQYDCMRIEWEQTCLIGPDSWAGGIIPTEIYLGFPPNVGTGHEGDYERIV